MKAISTGATHRRTVGRSVCMRPRTMIFQNDSHGDALREYDAPLAWGLWPARSSVIIIHADIALKGCGYYIVANGAVLFVFNCSFFFRCIGACQ